jgi:NADPH-dependent 2,4-dienoyl-CoA reductase/sulfur reductase-like enzyme
MPRSRIAVVGGLAAGPAAAAEAARTDSDADVLLIEAGPQVSVASCSIPAYLRGQVELASELVRFKPEELGRARRLDVRVCTQALSYDPRRGHLRLRDVRTGAETVERIDKLVLATGASARVPAWAEGVENVTPMRTLEDARRVRRWLDAGRLRHVVVLGGGYVGADTADALARRGVRVTLVEPSGALLERVVGGGLAQRVTQAAQEMGIAVRAERAMGVRLDGNRATAVVTDRGEWIGCDAVVTALGLEVRTELALSAGVALRADGTIKVDAHGRTSVPSVWACGDAIAVPSAVTGQPLHRPLAWDAFRSGRVAGANAARKGRGSARLLEPSTGASAVSAFGIEAAGVGLREEQALEAGLRVVSVEIVQKSRNEYHPLSAPTHVRLLAEARTGRLVGGELVGGDGAGLRANVLVPLVKAGASVGDLAALDLVYTPDLAPMHDPLQVAARALVEKMGTAR